MKRRLIGWIISVSMMMVIMLTRHGIVAAKSPSPWQSDVVEELNMDEWPVDEETIDEDERIYEMEALEAERQEEMFANSDNNPVGFEGEEEDDVDQDDIEEEDDVDQDDSEEEGDDEETAVYFGSSDVQQDESRTGEYDEIILPRPEEFSKATTKLQQQEEQDLEVLDQSIVDTLQSALDAMKQDRPVRFTPVNTTTKTNNTMPSVSPPSPSFFVALIHYLVSWTSYGGVCIFVTLAVLLILKKYKQRSIRDHHHLPVKIEDQPNVWQKHHHHRS